MGPPAGALRAAAATLLVLISPPSDALLAPPALVPAQSAGLRQRRVGVRVQGWLDAFLPAPMSDEEFLEDRKKRWPEQYAAPLDAWAEPVAGDEGLVARLRPLLASTQLESRPLECAFDAAVDGWTSEQFHAKVDTRGAALVYAVTEDGCEVGAYNPKGWASMGNARPSPAAFLYAFRGDGAERPTKLRSASHIGCNSCSSDAPSRGIELGVEALCVPLRISEDRGPGSERRAFSKLGVYYEGAGALWGGTQVTALAELKVFAGVYAPGEDYPYAGAVMDMTSG